MFFVDKSQISGESSGSDRPLVPRGLMLANVLLAADGSGPGRPWPPAPGGQRRIGDNTASEHIEVTRLAVAQLPHRARRQVLIRTDSGGGTHGFLTWRTAAPAAACTTPLA